MPKFFALPLVLLLGLMMVVTGCSDDDTSPLVGPEPEPYLARMDVQLVGGVADPELERVMVLTGYSEDGYEDMMGALILEPSDEGRLRIMDHDFYAGFPQFVSRVGNGQDENLYVCAYFTGGSRTTSALESQWLVSRQDEGGQPDFGDASISRVEAWIEPLGVDSPGLDPNGDGNWTDYSVRITYTFY